MTPEESPSWVVAAPQRPAPPRAPVPIRLRLLVVVTAALATAEAIHVAARDDLVAGFRIGLALVVVAQVPFAVLAARRSAIGACVLFVYLATTAVAATAGGFGDRQLGLALGTGVAAWLLASSLREFPTPQLPPIARLDPPDGP